jgi:hypothetical protein
VETFGGFRARPRAEAGHCDLERFCERRLAGSIHDRREIFRQELEAFLNRRADDVGDPSGEAGILEQRLCVEQIFELLGGQVVFDHGRHEVRRWGFVAVFTHLAASGAPLPMGEGIAVGHQLNA